MSWINNAKFEVTAYLCSKCNKWHKKPSKKFAEHFQFQHPIKPNPPHK